MQTAWGLMQVEGFRISGAPEAGVLREFRVCCCLEFLKGAIRGLGFLYAFFQGFEGCIFGAQGF